MKKLYTLLFTIALGTTISAQNLVVNGSFESWTTGVPDGWTTFPSSANGGSIEQEMGAANVQQGTSSLKVIAPAGTGNVKTAYTDIPVVAGQEYTFSYYYKDASDNAKGRHWAGWRSDTAQLDDNADVLRPNAYFANSAGNGFELVTITLTAPATATMFRLDFRVYQEATGQDSGVIHYDNVVFGLSALGVNKNDIAGLSVYPNPVTNGTLFINSTSGVNKSIVIYDILGKQVLKTVTANAVNVSNLNGGVYVLKITEDGKTATRKLVIK